MTHQIPLPIFYPGQRVRVYYLSFSGRPITGFYREGTIVGPDDTFEYIFNFVVERVFLPSGECPHSWMVGETGQFNIHYPSFEIIKEK
jgi:hypothetical protein